MGDLLSFAEGSGSFQVRLENPIRDHGEARLDRRFVDFQLQQFLPSAHPIEFIESRVGDGVISSQRVRCLIQVEASAAHEVAFRFVAATSLRY